MDGASQDSTMLVIVSHTEKKSHIAVNIQRDAVKTPDEVGRWEAREMLFWHAVAEGKQVFLTYDKNFANEGLHKWYVKHVVRDGAAQWEDKSSEAPE